MVTRSATEHHEYLRRYAYAAARHAGLDADERRAVAGMILGRDVATFKTLDAAELQRVVDGLRGWHFVAVVREQRGLPHARA